MQVQSIPQFISARSPDALQEEMFNVVSKLGMFVQFREIMQAKNGTWYAWFDLPLSRTKDLARGSNK